MLGSMGWSWEKSLDPRENYSSSSQYKSVAIFSSKISTSMVSKIFRLFFPVAASNTKMKAYMMAEPKEPTNTGTSNVVTN